MRHLVVWLLLTAILVDAQISTNSAPPPKFSRWYVHVVNGLSNNATLFVHCKSLDDDLGNQYLTHLGDDFQWNFKMNFWGTTLFWCYLSKPGANVSFEIFWQEVAHLWLHYRCTTIGTPNIGTCIWTAKDDGIYLRNTPDNVDELIHTWNITR